MKHAMSIGVLVFTVSCGAGGAQDAPDADLFTPDASPADLLPDFSVAPANVNVIELENPGGRVARVLAWLATSQPEPYTEVDAEGSCRLVAYKPSLCTPACNFDESCNSDGVCRGWSEFLSAGTITLGGLTASVSLRQSSGYYSAEPTQIPGDLFAADSTISASAPGDTFPAFNLTTSGVAPLEFTPPDGNSDELRLTDGADVVVSWSNRDNGSRVKLRLPTPNQAHGLPSLFVIECEGLDTGSFVIARRLVEALPLMQRAEICVGHDCPLSTLERYRSGKDETGPAELRLSAISQTSFYLSHGN